MNIQIYLQGTYLPLTIYREGGSNTYMQMNTKPVVVTVLLSHIS